MGRRPNAPSQKADGYWYSRHPGLKRTVRLAATSFTEAVAEQNGFYGLDATSTPVDAVLPSDSVPAGLGMDVGNGDSVLNLDDEPTPPGGGKKADSATDLLTSWSKSTAPVAETTTPVVQTGSPNVSGDVSSSRVQSGPPNTSYLVGKPKVQKGLSPEQSAKIASGLKKMVVNTNIVVMGAAIQMFGVIPAPLDPEEISLLQMGWEMYLDELFAKAKLKPLHLVLVGNLSIAVSMWAAGEKKKKPDPKVDPTNAKSAPGHTATVTPIQPPKG